MNILEILKNISEGTKLYSPAFGEVIFKCIYGNKIMVEDVTNIQRLFYSNGNFYKDGECMLFPSRENRNWNNICLFKDGDILISISGNPFIFKELKDNICSIYCGIDTGGNFWEYSSYWTNIKGARKATEKEIELFFERLKKEGLKWNSNTLTLEKLENKFDINTLKPFDKVLVRDEDTDYWKASIYSHYAGICKYRYVCVANLYSQCIPYNDETKHLVGTNKDCTEYYKTW